MAPPKPKNGSEGSASGGNTPGSGNVINLMMLSPQQLTQLRQQVEQELQFYQEAIMSLKEIQVKMQDAGVSVQKIQQLGEGKNDLLVPVTGSMFVRGELEDRENVLIDIGTGYYVEKSLADACDYFKRKVEFLTTQIEKVQSVGREKSNVRAAILEVLEGKLQAAQMASATTQKKPTKA